MHGFYLPSFKLTFLGDVSDLVLPLHFQKVLQDI